MAGAIFAAVMTGIVANAVMFQKGRHPSPLFAPAEQAVPTPVQHLTPPVPVPIPRSVVDQATPTDSPIAPPIVAGPASTATVPQPKHHAVVPAKPQHAVNSRRSSDPIGGLIRATGSAPAKAPSSAAKSPAKPKRDIASTAPTRQH